MTSDSNRQGEEIIEILLETSNIHPQNMKHPPIIKHFELDQEILKAWHGFNIDSHFRLLKIHL
ncbi:hypothetical protein Glove_166g159 [Diversispora epigaea]|uniref:Uncharacterized protein n=1 Tax=Diversispora epigaea TaxID=1348612 RepID=A0A397IQD8_9GLOM|nr:hypothetical protein Glove_166g159 [Diversispora epigaea]